MYISTLLNLINYIFVLIFGIIVSFYFADIRLEDNHKLVYIYNSHICVISGCMLSATWSECAL